MRTWCSDHPTEEACWPTTNWAIESMILKVILPTLSTHLNKESCPDSEQGRRHGFSKQADRKTEERQRQTERLTARLTDRKTDRKTGADRQVSYQKEWELCRSGMSRASPGENMSHMTLVCALFWELFWWLGAALLLVLYKTMKCLFYQLLINKYLHSEVTSLHQ